MNKKALIIGLSALSGILLNGCATTSVFSSYTKHAKNYKACIECGCPTECLEAQKEKHDSDDKILYYEESGRVSYLAGEIEESKKYFEAAATSIDEEWAKPDATLSELAGSALTNDNAIAYRGKSYEKILIHTYQSLNYWEQGDLEGAAVEARRASNEQVMALDNHQKELIQAEEAAKKNSIDLENQQAGINKWCEAMPEVSPSIKNSFQNALTYYLSGVLWEIYGEPDNALVAYKQAFDIYPSNTYTAKNILRIAEQLGIHDDVEYIKQYYPNLDPHHLTSEKGRIVVIYEDGFVPEKQELNIPIILPRLESLSSLKCVGIQLQNIAVPYYSKHHRSCVCPLNVGSCNTCWGKTQTICDIRSMAIKDLQEEMNPIIVRQIVRLVAKYALSIQCGKASPLLGIACGIYNVMSERADLRSWSTLPEEIQIADFWVPEGDYPLILNPYDLECSQFTAHVKADKVTLVRVIRAGSSYYVKVI